MSDDIQAQENELFALDSIYNDESIFLKVKDGGQFCALLQLPDDFSAIVHPITKINSDNKHVTNSTAIGKKEKFPENDAAKLYKISHLPPIVLNFKLLQCYPSVDPPRFTLSCKWLPPDRITLLCRKLDDIWQDMKGCEVLFQWCDFLQNETLSFLDINTPLDVTPRPYKHKIADIDLRAIQDISSSSLVLSTILAHNETECAKVFNKTLFTCNVCFSEKIGCNCIQFKGCDHVFCKVCMAGYFTVQVKEGNVKALNCPEEKCDSQANPAQVKELVSAELYLRYDRLLLQSSLDMMSDVVICPRRHCETPVLLEKDNIMGRCPSCHFTFCSICKFTYHGVSACRVNNSDKKKIYEQYLNATEQEKELLNQRYGKLNIQKILDDGFSEKWIADNSKLCPECKAAIEKIDGCNKMTCIKCRCYFCWLCSHVLCKANPYAHYNIRSSDCYQKLFLGGPDPLDDEFEDFFEDEDEWENDVAIQAII